MKYADAAPVDAGERSHPTGVRGLKSVALVVWSMMGMVAPHWGAWIEMVR